MVITSIALAVSRPAWVQPALLTILGPPMTAGFLSFLAIAAWMGKTATAPGMPDLGIRSPLDLLGALRMALLITGVILLSGLVQRNFGSAGLYVVAAISGLADVDAITISIARMASDPHVLARTILIAVAANSASKAVLATWIGHQVIGLWFIWATLAGMIAAGAVYALI